MANHQRQSGHNVTCVLLTFYIVTFLSIPLPLRSLISCNAHLIHIDDEHHEFRSSGFPRPHLPPPLPPPPEQLPPPHLSGRELTPAECMVDLTNELAYRVLHYHSILNRNNFAFSPTALMSVLVAVYEGSAGRSATELKNVLQFPNNRDIVRVGYRDIHRRLRTYFFGSDNPLKGLSLNKENVTITRDFEAILMFYGYDLGVDMVSSTAAPTTTEATTSTTTTTTTTAEKDTTTETATTTTTPAPTPTTTEEIKETTTTMETTRTTMETTTPVTTAPPTPLTTTPPTPTTTMAITTNTEEATTTQAPTTIGSDIAETTTETVTTQVQPDTTTDTLTPEDTTTETTAEATTTAPASPAIEAAELISSFVAEANSEPLQRIQKARVTRLPSAKLLAPPLAKMPHVNYLPSQRKSKRLSTNRRKRHLFGFKDFESNLFVSLLNSEPHLHGLAPATPLASYVQVSNEFEVDTDPNFIGTSTTAAKQNYNTDVITHVFYLSSQQVIYTTFKVYNAVLYYKYFEHLHMTVLELELDTPEYNLIILLPDYNTDLVAAASSLRSGPKLRLMRKQLKPKWVQAIIPDFKLQGTMFLTNDLQNMGICDIFEPNRADFRPMTDETGTYVKHIEQSINIHIRTHPINQVRRNSGAQAQPTPISVNHPFMFFIIDRDLDVAVMSGRILNPLNVRIQ